MKRLPSRARPKTHPNDSSIIDNAVDVPWVVKNNAPGFNTIPSYIVGWDKAINDHTGMTRSGNRYTSKDEAERVYRKKLAEGRNPNAVIHYIGGWL